MRKIWASEEGGGKDYKEVITQPTSDLLTNDTSIRTLDNTIYFYSDISVIACSELNRLLREVDIRLNQAKLSMDNETFEPIIHLRINSYGGDVLAGLSTVDTIRSLKSHVYTYVEGAAASAATLITVAGKKRFIGKNSMMLIHQLSSVCSGTFERLNDEQQNNRRIMDLIKSIYKQYTKIPMKELETILKRDLWLDSDTCLKYGIVDKVN
jgi:ATP-dependent Clp endopeptidase proteolytic subunit ClpP